MKIIKSFINNYNVSTNNNKQTDTYYRKFTNTLHQDRFEPSFGAGGELIMPEKSEMNKLIHKLSKSDTGKLDDNETVSKTITKFDKAFLKLKHTAEQNLFPDDKINILIKNGVIVNYKPGKEATQLGLQEFEEGLNPGFVLDNTHTTLVIKRINEANEKLNFLIKNANKSKELAEKFISEQFLDNKLISESGSKIDFIFDKKTAQRSYKKILNKNYSDSDIEELNKAILNAKELIKENFINGDRIELTPGLDSYYKHNLELNYQPGNEAIDLGLEKESHVLYFDPRRIKETMADELTNTIQSIAERVNVAKGIKETLNQGFLENLTIKEKLINTVSTKFQLNTEEMESLDKIGNELNNIEIEEDFNYPVLIENYGNLLPKFKEDNEFYNYFKSTCESILGEKNPLRDAFKYDLNAKEASSFKNIMTELNNVKNGQKYNRNNLLNGYFDLLPKISKNDEFFYDLKHMCESILGKDNPLEESLKSIDFNKRIDLTINDLKESGESLDKIIEGFNNRNQMSAPEEPEALDEKRIHIKV